MAHKLLALSVFITLLVGCTNSGENANTVTVEKTYLDSLEKQAEEYQKWRSAKQAGKKDGTVEKDLSGHFDAYENQSAYDSQTIRKAYSLIIEKVTEVGHSDPNKYRVKNLLNEGGEWKLSGVLEGDLLVLSGKNVTNTKRVNGSIQLTKGNNDSLLVELTIRENVKKTDDLIQEVHETWVRKEAH